MAISFKLNNKETSLDVDPQMPLLWAIRDYAGLTGTKFSCGIAVCGACVVLMDGTPVRSCVMPISAAVGKSITTIEGLSQNNDHPVQKAWIEAQVPQCGYCQSGQILSAVALLEKNPNPTDTDIDNAMNSVLCRCGTYPRVRKAIKMVSK
ncbi:MAG: (2Fe-2S)-binding protein [Cyclobacteriaceae bacterium]